jgi:hypothetical protein
MTRPTILRTLILLASLMNEYGMHGDPSPMIEFRINRNPTYRVPIVPTF